MCSLKETADPPPRPAFHLPLHAASLLSLPPPTHRCGTGSPSEGGAADVKSKEKKKQQSLIWPVGWMRFGCTMVLF